MSQHYINKYRKRYDSSRTVTIKSPAIVDLDSIKEFNGIFLRNSYDDQSFSSFRHEVSKIDFHLEIQERMSNYPETEIDGKLNRRRISDGIVSNKVLTKPIPNKNCWEFLITISEEVLSDKSSLNLYSNTSSEEDILK